MFWQLQFSPKSEKAFKKLDPSIQKQIKIYFNETVLKTNNPLIFAKHLQHNLADFYRFRIGKIRILCTVQKMKLIITVVKIGHRREIYD